MIVVVLACPILINTIAWLFFALLYTVKRFFYLLNNEEFLKEDAMQNKTIIYEIVHTSKDLIEQKKQEYLQTKREAGQ